MKTKTSVIVACLALSVVAQPALAQSVPAANHKTLAAPGGRYVFGQVSEHRRDQYMLDTKDGQLWHIVRVTSDSDPEGYLVLSAVPYDQGNGVSLTPSGPVGTKLK